MLPRHRLLTLAIQCVVVAALLLISPVVAAAAFIALVVHLLFITKGRW